MSASTPPDHQASECARHSGAAASWWCERCGHNLCDKCVQVHQTVPAAFATCKACGAACRVEGPPPAEEEPDERPFLQRLAGVFAYPFGGSGWILLLAGALCFSCSCWRPFLSNRASSCLWWARCSASWGRSTSWQLRCGSSGYCTTRTGSGSGGLSERRRVCWFTVGQGVSGGKVSGFRLQV